MGGFNSVRLGLNAFLCNEVKAYYVGRVCILDFQHLHRSYHGLHCHKDVLIDQFNEPSLIFIGIAGTMDDSHLLDKRWLAWFSSSFKKEKWNKSVEKRHPGKGTERHAICKTAQIKRERKKYRKKCAIASYLITEVSVLVLHPVYLFSVVFQFLDLSFSAPWLPLISNTPWSLVGAGL